MTPDNLKRKLTTILSADVKGYSRLMGEDEEWTLRTLTNYKGIIRNLVGEHRGRVISSPGDNVLAEFASVVDAVQCAVEIQQMLRAKNAVLPETRRMEFRIGINLGDVIEEGDSIYGDGVNIAARLEGLAEAGGICISGSAYEQIENKIPLQYDYLGEHEVKNIARPVRVYRAKIEPEAVPSIVLEEKKPEKKKISRALMAGIALVLIAAAAALYLFAFRPTASKTEVASKEKMAFPLPDKPSIAVLPFANMSGDPKQEFFCDGITEDIITALSKIPRLFVIASNSTFTYKGKPVKVKQVSEELGVRYVLEGSVQRSGDRVRITAQLIDTLSGHHLWSERYERDMKDLFALQDEVTLRILTALQVKLVEGEHASFGEKFFGRKQGLDCYLKIWESTYYLRLFSKEGLTKARQIAEEIITRWPENPWGYANSSYTHYIELFSGSTKFPQESLKKAIELSQKAITLDSSNYYAHTLLGLSYCYLKEYDKAISEGERAIDLSPNSSVANGNHAYILTFAGRYKDAIPYYFKTIRINPLISTFYIGLGNCYLFLDRYEEAAKAYKQAIRLAPDMHIPHTNLASVYMALGREKEARAEAAEVLRINPKFSLDNWERAGRAVFKNQEDINRYISRLRKLGMK
jgi:adenylate cyclase